MGQAQISWAFMKAWDHQGTWCWCMKGGNLVASYVYPGPSAWHVAHRGHSSGFPPPSREAGSLTPTIFTPPGHLPLALQPLLLVLCVDKSTRGWMTGV